ncbi:MAG: iron chelate uptake ABC transporter family permease subunit [Clostridium baratii]|uniref:FecCD transport family protein n=1 Tax=Clostridium baratii str. Sullivan TaxID=1415775 RepID=A0A0A7FS63_9CLOT|nr:iron chelate uptake ABC transporter family permease subunit [Clostridium baratii]AIY82484.1 fecCD transport family protein [Clostridium baratii str. Sullivan]MBS6006114.1 iron chelate uptake ABC transporter family permease subunit [Clostridium baratii]MDU1053186.1 iron chelate uptake ABC transporter family permease subunit [Clostridium baratii]MDU4911285.1 iron chelate uptake ABC transporter family permease subunit [Clostridium baratii]CUP12541.1 iron chelate uptake ABC transporter permease
MKKRYLIPVVVILSLISIVIGVANINIFSMGQEDINIVLISRVPRLISILVAGCGMSICGVIMQQISNNKFVSPTTAATIDSAKLGVLFSIIIFGQVTMVQKMILAFIFSLIGTFIFMIILKKVKVKNTIFIPLVGIMVGNVIGSITDFFAFKFNLIQNMGSFLQGNFSSILKGNYEMLYLSIPMVILAFLYVHKFTLVGMGEEMSTNLGLNYKRVTNIGVTIVSLVSALVIITVGTIPFIGLIIPNIVSIFLGDNLSKNMPIVALLGSIFLLICDIISRILIFPYEIPIDLTVGVIGGIIFLYLIFRRNK